MSSSIPFVLPPVEYKGRFFIDGGVSMNYPISIFDPKDASCLGFYLDSMYSSSDINQDPLGTEKDTDTKYELKKYVLGIFNVVFNSNMDTLLKMYGHNTVFLDCNQENLNLTTPLGFKTPTKEYKQTLKDQGYKIMKEIIK
jgi:predicted acylesterase/phospholipase RssA